MQKQAADFHAAAFHLVARRVFYAVAQFTQTRAGRRGLVIAVTARSQSLA